MDEQEEQFTEWWEEEGKELSVIKDIAKKIWDSGYEKGFWSVDATSFD